MEKFIRIEIFTCNNTSLSLNRYVIRDIFISKYHINLESKNEYYNVQSYILADIN